MKNKVVRFVMVTVFLLIVTGLSILVGRWQITSGATSAAFPQGTYTSEMTRSDFPAGFPAQFIPVLAGRWEITFAEAGRHTVIKDGRLVVESHYAATQNQIALYKDKGPLACDIQEGDTRPFFPPGSPATSRSGTYTWTFDGRMLTFAKIADECGGRVLTLTAHPWAKRR